MTKLKKWVEPMAPKLPVEPAVQPATVIAGWYELTIYMARVNEPLPMTIKVERRDGMAITFRSYEHAQEFMETVCRRADATKATAILHKQHG